MEINVFQGILEFNWNLLFSAVTVLVLYLILKRFFFQKVHDFMMARQAGIEEQLIHADNTEKKARELLEEYSRTLEGAEEESRQLVKDAKITADERAAGIIEGAKAEAAEIMSQAHRKIEQEEEIAVAKLKKEIGTLAILAASRIMEKELEDGGQEALVEKVLQEAERGKWQNQ